MKYHNLPPLTDAQLRRVAARNPPTGYPATRLHIEPEKWAKMVRDNRITLPYSPDAPWRVNNHPNRVHAPEAERHLIDPSIEEQPIDSRRSEAWRTMGLWTDHETGEAIHYYAGQLLTTVGMYAGLGFLFQHGPQGTVSAMIRRARAGIKSQYLVIQRSDNETWCLPTGFREPGEPDEIAAMRENHEETGLVSEHIGGLAVIRNVELSVGSDWDTVNSWAERCVVAIENPNQEYLWDAQPMAGDDAIDVAWLTPAQVETMREAGEFGERSAGYIRQEEARLSS